MFRNKHPLNVPDSEYPTSHYLQRVGGKHFPISIINEYMWWYNGTERILQISSSLPYLYLYLQFPYLFIHIGIVNPLQKSMYYIYVVFTYLYIYFVIPKFSQINLCILSNGEFRIPHHFLTSFLFQCHGFIEVIPFRGLVGCRDQCEHRDVGCSSDSISTVGTDAAKREEGWATLKGKRISSLKSCQCEIIGIYLLNYICSWDDELMYFFLRVMCLYWYFLGR